MGDGLPGCGGMVVTAVLLAVSIAALFLFGVVWAIATFFGLIALGTIAAMILASINDQAQM